jgi:hypothetical protein
MERAEGGSDFLEQFHLTGLWVGPATQPCRRLGGGQREFIVSRGRNMDVANVFQLQQLMQAHLILSVQRKLEIRKWRR